MDLDALLSALSIDREQIGERFSGNFTLYERFLRKFPQDPTFAALRQARDEGEREAYLAAVHTLKGVAGNLGLSRLFELASQLLVALRAGQTFEQTQALDDQLTAAYMQTKEWIERP